MKRIFVALVLLSLVILPAAALAQDIKIGGYLKLDTFWDSSQVSKNLGTPVYRNNHPSGQHGRFNATAQSSRFNFTIKGPMLFGAQTSGFLEMDMDQQLDTRQSASNSYVPRMRHAFFRLNWPGTELLMGQYWGMFCNFYPDAVQDGSYQNHGQATQRLAQIRLTQTFLNSFSVSGLVGKPYDPTAADSNFEPTTGAGQAQQLAGQTSETPQFQISAKFEQDLYGKAAFYGRPRPFTFEVAAAFQRTRYQSGALVNTAAQVAAVSNVRTFGQNNFTPLIVGSTWSQRDQQYMTPWVVQWTLFAPIIPTSTPNLAGTASMTAQMYVGQGLSFIGNGLDADNTYFVFSAWRNNTPGVANGLYDRKMTKQYGGYVQGQYYFNNEWYLTYIYGMQKAYGITQDRDTVLQAVYGISNPAGRKYATINDQTKMWQEHVLALYYRPIQAVKFGLQYSYSKTDYLQVTTVQTRSTDFGDNHRIEFAGWFFF